MQYLRQSRVSGGRENRTEPLERTIRAFLSEHLGSTRQVELLSNAKSLTDRVFTRDESAQNHCQIGNVGLALETMARWIQVKADTGR